MSRICVYVKRDNPVTDKENIGSSVISYKCKSHDELPKMLKATDMKMSCELVYEHHQAFVYYFDDETKTEYQMIWCQYDKEIDAMRAVIDFINNHYTFTFISTLEERISHGN